MLRVTPTRPKFHRVLKEKMLPDGTIQYTFRYNPALFKLAKCAGLDTEVFYPPQEKFDLSEEKYITQRLCGNCPVKEACLEWGLVHERYGIWGGTTPYRRRFIRKARGWGFNEIALPNWQR